MNKLCVFIITYGRPDNQVTYRSLRRQGYTGKIYFVCDDSDVTLDDYKKRYGDDVLVFSKQQIYDRPFFDDGDNFKEMRAPIYARHACYDFARNLNIKFFFQFDDDYSLFRYTFNHKGEYFPHSIKELDAVFLILLKFYKQANIDVLAFAQGGDMMGGESGQTVIRTKRKAMNSWLCDIDRPINFVGRMNEDCNTYTIWGLRGKIFLTTFQIALLQTETQKDKGGMTEVYQESGTYVKTFYTIMYAPSCTKVSTLGRGDLGKFPRIHHKISWGNAVPKIVSDKHKKGLGNGEEKRPTDEVE